ncbi:MAG TPA: phosphatidylinositol kinase, partial [Acidimicrobiales bacterium]|nr:phosphatidylinositol kinase [Acidimicrobiales bacterium]
MGLLHGASNYTFLARLGPYPPDGLQAVYKPARGESPLWDFESGSLYRREVAAYELSKVLGWPNIPPTIVREKAPHGVGAVQLFIDADRRHFL